MSRAFDPRPHLRQLANGAPHLDVKWRLHWLRTEHADAQIDTNLVSVEGDVVICRASVRLPNGGSASAHGAASRSGGASMADLIERAESRALGRALATLGYGAQYLEEDAVNATRPATSAAASAAASASPTPAREPYDDGSVAEQVAPAPAPQRQRPAAAAQQQPQPDPRAYDDPDAGRQRDARQMRETRPERPDRGDRYERDTQAPPTAPAAPAAPATPAVPMRRGSELRGHDAPRMGDTPAREDVAWQRFWEWARARGYRDADHLREILGVEVLALTPREVRDLIRRFELDHPPGADDDL